MLLIVGVVATACGSDTAGDAVTETTMAEDLKKYVLIFFSKLTKNPEGQQRLTRKNEL